MVPEGEWGGGGIPVDNASITTLTLCSRGRLVRGVLVYIPECFFIDRWGGFVP